jgi:hypothetical protein
LFEDAVRSIMIFSPLKLPLAKINTSMLLPIAAGLLIFGCSAPRENAPAKSDAAPASETVIASNGGATSVDAKTSSNAPLTASEEDELRRQIESNWNVGEWATSPEATGMEVELRLSLLPDGTIADVKLLNDRPGDATFQKVADSAIRAVKISSPLRLPPGREYSAMILRFRPDWQHP